MKKIVHGTKLGQHTESAKDLPDSKQVKHLLYLGKYNGLCVGQGSSCFPVYSQG